jgi:hypothetical protein
MLEAVNNPRFGSIVGRHLHSYAIAYRQANETFAHFAGNVGKNKMIVRKRDPKHRSGQHRGDRSFNRDCFLRIHHWRICGASLLIHRCHDASGIVALQFPEFTGDYSRMNADRRRRRRRRKDADVPRGDALRSQLTRGR